ncbi:MAG: septum formation initiator family protein [Clostridiales bacterium]|nr:septum formation initiator family protein [Clostridiales bacterium]
MIAKRRRKNGRAGRLYIGAIATVFMIAMFAQIVKVYQKDQEYIEREAKLEEELLQETIRQQELEQYEVYTRTNQYVEDVAKSKLGLAYGNEIIFKEEE